MDGWRLPTLLNTIGKANDGHRWRAKEIEERIKMVELWRQRKRCKVLGKDGKPRRKSGIERTGRMGEVEIMEVRTHDMIPTDEFHGHREEFGIVAIGTGSVWWIDRTTSSYKLKEKQFK